MKTGLLLMAGLSCLIMGSVRQDKEKLGSDTALIIIDVQDFYFPGGSTELVHPEEAAAAIKRVLNFFRQHQLPIIHVRHNVQREGDIHHSAAPLPGEKIISKDYANCFRDTDLLVYLHEHGITSLVLCGMQTHMCLEAGTRAAVDLGFSCIVISDGCATGDLTYDHRTVRAADVQTATLASLNRTYAQLLTANQFIDKYR